MPDEPKTIEDIMADAWNQTMGEAEELPDENQHLFVETDDKPTTPEPAPPEPNADTPVVAEPVSAEPTSAETPPSAAELSAPQHWSEPDRTMFSSLNDEAKGFLLRRHRDMEADYTRKTQENAAAVRIGQVVASELDPAVRNQLTINNISEDKFIKNLISFHRFSMADPVGFIKTAMTNLKLDPAQVFGTTSSDPAAKPVPDDPLNQRLAAIETHLTRDVQARQQAAVDNAKNELQRFAEEKDATGNPLRPHLQTVRTVMGRLMSVDPDLDLQQAYEVAVFRDPELRKTLSLSVPPTAGTPTVPVDMDKIKRGEEAARAAKSNRRGSGNGASTAPTVKPNMTLQEAMNAAADEVGLK